MPTEHEIKDLICKLYAQINGKPEEIEIVPKDGGWGVALSYLVIRTDGKKARVLRKHIDDDNQLNIIEELKRFS